MTVKVFYCQALGTKRLLGFCLEDEGRREESLRNELRV